MVSTMGLGYSDLIFGLKTENHCNSLPAGEGETVNGKTRTSQEKIIVKIKII